MVNFISKGVQVQVKDTVINQSKSFTVHNISFKNLFNRLYFFSKALEREEGNVKIVCRRDKKEETDKNDQKETY